MKVTGRKLVFARAAGAPGGEAGDGGLGVPAAAPQISRQNMRVDLFCAGNKKFTEKLRIIHSNTIRS